MLWKPHKYWTAERLLFVIPTKSESSVFLKNQSHWIPCQARIDGN
jgi:hypothetical protein